MGLVRVNTGYFEVVNTSDPDVVALTERPENQWIPLSEASVSDGATKIRIRALSRREFDSINLSDDGNMLGALTDAGVHDGDRQLISGPEPLPWHFQRSLGALIYRISTYPLSATK
jgi:hypothetical protein